MANQTEEDLLFGVLRSLYRFSSLLKDSSCPTSILDFEKNILSTRLLNLDFDQIKKISLIWKNYVQNNQMMDIIHNFNDSVNFEKYLHSMN